MKGIEIKMWYIWDNWTLKIVVKIWYCSHGIVHILRIVEKFREWIRKLYFKRCYGKMILLVQEILWSQFGVLWLNGILWYTMEAQFSVNSKLDYNYFRKWLIFIYWSWLMYAITVWYYKIWYFETWRTSMSYELWYIVMLNFARLYGMKSELH